MSSFVPIHGSQTQVNNYAITDGSLLVSTDNGKLFVDVGSSRIAVTDIHVIPTGSYVTDILAPIFGKLYYEESSNTYYCAKLVSGSIVWYAINPDTVPIERLPVGSGANQVAAGNHTHAAANISGLATVATTGNYTDLTNKPSIPAAYTLPTASTTELGGVKVDGSTVTIHDGIISAECGNAGINWVNVPTHASAPGTAGDIAFDTNYMYICIFANTWRRIAHDTWEGGYTPYTVTGTALNGVPGDSVTGTILTLGGTGTVTGTTLTLE